jgi:hypothetical protein
MIKESIISIEKMAKLDIKTKLSDSFKYIVDHTVNKQMEEIKEKLAKELN